MIAIGEVVDGIALETRSSIRCGVADYKTHDRTCGFAACYNYSTYCACMVLAKNLCI
jgi:hypothetical protein